MAGGKQTPRQRMMGILYLVLLGLIALDVPESLLDAFKAIGDSLAASKTNVQNGINNTYTAFEKTKLKDEPERAKGPYAKAKQASAMADELNNYVESLKKKLVNESGGFDPAINDYKGRENIDLSVNTLINASDKPATTLKNKINETRDKLLGLLSAKERTGVNLALSTEAPPKVAGFPAKTWEEANFGEGMPVGAAITNFIKIQSDIKNSENEVIKKILGEVDQAQVNLDQFNAVVVAPSSYVLVGGQPYTAEVFLTASDSKSTPSITVDGSKLPTEGGKGKYTGSLAEGIHTWTGTINLKQADGSFKTYKTNPQTYQVAKPSAVVSPDKMLVLYIGVPNPVSVSAPGIPKEKLKVSISGGGSLSGTNGHYIATVTAAGTATVSVSGTIGDGANAKTVTLGSTEFRVKRIPDPKAVFAGKGGGAMGTANIKAQDAIFARLDGFEFDAKFNITHFTLLILKPRQDLLTYSGSSNELTAEMHKQLNTIVPGTLIVFQNIIAVGPDGTQRGLDNIAINAN